MIDVTQQTQGMMFTFYGLKAPKKKKSKK
jgi:hypothetical protein